MVGGKGWGGVSGGVNISQNLKTILSCSNIFHVDIISNIEMIFYSVNFKIIPPNRQIFYIAIKLQNFNGMDFLVFIGQ